MQVLDVMFGASDLDDAPGLEVSESSAAGATVEDRKLEHHYPHAPKEKYRES